MSAPIPLLHRHLPRWCEPIAVLVATFASWITMGLIYRYGGTNGMIGVGTLWGPCTLLLTYFMFGGDIPLKWRQKGYRRLMMIPVLFWISFPAFVVVVHFFPPSPK